MNLQRKKQLENLANSFNIGFKEVEQMYEFAKNKIKAETGKDGPALEIMAIHAVKAHYTQRNFVEGKELNFIYLGKDRSRDANRNIVQERLKKFHSDPASRKKLMRRGKVRLMKVPKDNAIIEIDGSHYAPVTEIHESHDVDDEPVVTKGDIWTPGCGKDPILRDDRQYLDDAGQIENFNFKQNLEESWRTTLFGIGFFEENPKVKKKVQVRFFGERGNPNSGQFVCNTMELFEPYKLKVRISENLSDDLCFVVNAVSKPVLDKKPGVEIDVVGMIDDINQEFANKLAAKGKEPRSLIPIVPLSELKEWHKQYRARKNEHGEIIKAKSGWDLTNWDEYCLIDQVTYLGVQDFSEKYKPISIQHDSTGQETFFANYDSEIGIEEVPVPSDLVISVKTGRGTTKYDRESKETIQNAEDPDLSINVCGYKVLMSYEKIVFPQELQGDM